MDIGIEAAEVGVEATNIREYARNQNCMCHQPRRMRIEPSK